MRRGDSAIVHSRNNKQQEMWLYDQWMDTGRDTVVARVKLCRSGLWTFLSCGVTLLCSTGCY